MERESAYSQLKDLFGKAFLGPEEIEKVSGRLQLAASIPGGVPEIPFEMPFLKERRDTHYLFLGIPIHSDGSPLTILSLRSIFGLDPTVSEPCFYNQDWYLKEKFAAQSFRPGWYLFSRSLLESTRSKPVNEILAQPEVNGKLPSAVLCSYFFFLSYLVYGQPVIKHDYIWNSDLDANGDRIYVGKYIDPLGINKNGWEIHRHLSIKRNYGALQIYE
jgi:hypothetical protein